MALLVAPYQPSMRLGSGFNTFTQEIRIDDAVIRDTSIAPQQPDLFPKADGDVAQTVMFKTEVIKKMSDLTEALDINGTQSIKASSVANVRGNGNFVNSNAFKESDVNYLISCKVVNQTVQDYSLNKFNPVLLSKTTNFTDVYGDSFISGFQLGGEFTALISIAIQDKAEREEVIKSANAAFTAPNMLLTPPPLDIPPGATPPEDLPPPPQVPHEGDEANKKIRSEILSKNTVTISVSYTGGGQRVKNPNEDWNFETLRDAAIRFPLLVAQTPVPTHAILTKYSALRSWHTAMDRADGQPPASYENVKVYTTMLQDAYLDYKKLYTDIQLLAIDVDAGLKELVSGNTRLLGESRNSEFNGSTDEEPPKKSPDAAKPPPFELNKPYPASLVGLELTKRDIRINMTRILLEVDHVAQDPRHAMKEDGEVPFMGPLVFKQYVPRAKVLRTSEGTSTATNGVSE